MGPGHSPWGPGNHPAPSASRPVRVISVIFGGRFSRYIRDYTFRILCVLESLAVGLTLLGDTYFCLPLNILELCSGTQLSSLEAARSFNFCKVESSQLQ